MTPRGIFKENASWDWRSFQQVPKIYDDYTNFALKSISQETFGLFGDFFPIHHSNTSNGMMCICTCQWIMK